MLQIAYIVNQHRVINKQSVKISGFVNAFSGTLLGICFQDLYFKNFRVIDYESGVKSRNSRWQIQYGGPKSTK